jgi:PBP4 family serine-type D-alanyl-D-alanine carboxypeptidase
MPDSIGVKRELCQNRVYVWGTGRNLNVKIAVQNPALWAARILKKEMQRAGIQVNGDIRSVNWITANRPEIKMANELAVIDSKPLSEIVYRMNKHSINLYAELILRTLGKKFGEFVPEDDPKFREVRTDDRAGIAVIKKWLSEHEITLHKSEALHDGSGLSRLNLLTPQTIGRALIAATKIKDSEAFLNSLPVAGKDGTMTNRLHDLSDKLMAKTGNITSVASLAGYLNLKDETLVFVVLSNNVYDSTKANELIDKLVREISLLH